MSKQNIYDNPEFYDGYRKLRERERNYNNMFEQPYLRSLLPPLEGLRVLDLGCGSGPLCRYLASQGAVSVAGVDISEKMLSDAQNHPGHRQEIVSYSHCPMEDFEPEGMTFDLVVSSLAIQYVEDYEALIANIGRSLTGGGRLVFSIEHPMMTGSPEAWVKDKDGNKVHWPVDQYSIEGSRERHWFVDGVIKYHRRLDTTVNTLIENGLTIERLLEPVPTDEEVENYPSLIDERVRPAFLFVKCRK